MATIRCNIGFHAGPGGNHTNWGLWWSTLDQSNIPVFAKSADSAGQLFEIQNGAINLDLHTLIYRTSTRGKNNGIEYDVPNYLNNPELLETEADAMISALWFWNRKNLNKWADLDDVKMVSKIINGGYNGLKHREELLKEYKLKFGVK